MGGSLTMLLTSTALPMGRTAARRAYCAASASNAQRILVTGTHGGMGADMLYQLREQHGRDSIFRVEEGDMKGRTIDAVAKEHGAKWIINIQEVELDAAA